MESCKYSAVCSTVNKSKDETELSKCSGRWVACCVLVVGVDLMPPIRIGRCARSHRGRLQTRFRIPGKGRVRASSAYSRDIASVVIRIGFASCCQEFVGIVVGVVLCCSSLGLSESVPCVVTLIRYRTLQGHFFTCARDH